MIAMDNELFVEIVLQELDFQRLKISFKNNLSISSNGNMRMFEHFVTHERSKNLQKRLSISSNVYLCVCVCVCFVLNCD